ncbi:sigma-54-dependent transcriptional regulator [Eleftheria terrae]|uniref:sigma-54-dependent transcriptional regulator n=1 Tax=Eleftheria terrae TaxID=1597781 RepID=UPI00263A8B27|nr:sigma-54 dependent transcriptional regulator [Eleftheria terrae]WKB53554.1 sigma-54 dependent transcriptional regulator [Eleftheria terrae]
MVHALIVDDDLQAAETLASLVAAEGYSTATAHSLHHARRQLASRAPDVVLLDLHLPDGSGMDLLREAPVASSRVVFITAHASVDTSVEALRRGAADYLTKPLRFADLQRLLGDIAARAEAPAPLSAAARPDRTAAGQPLGRSAGWLAVCHQARRVAGSDLTVFITGETGCGKEVLARFVHGLSRRREGPFCAVHCGSLSPRLVESELFGHERGAFTGAHERRLGIFERADRGTLFLDDITEMPLDMQVRLLRVLETGCFRRVGGTVDIAVDVRVIAASSQVPLEAARAGRVREDLLYRLNVYPLQVPSLLERIDDVPLLARAFLAECCEREGVSRTFSAAAMQRLMQHSWPGNVRELRNVVQRACLMAEAEVIEAEHLSLGAPLLRTPCGASPTCVRLSVGMALADALQAVTLATYRICCGHRERTARLLGISKKTLYTRLIEYGLHAGLAPGPPEPGSP